MRRDFSNGADVVAVITDEQANEIRAYLFDMEEYQKTVDNA